MEVNETGQCKAYQDKDAPQKINDGLTPLKISPNLFQWVDKEDNKDEQGD